MKLSFRNTVVSHPALKQMCLLDTVEMGLKQKLQGERKKHTASRPAFLRFHFGDAHFKLGTRLQHRGKRFTTAHSTSICAQARHDRRNSRLLFRTRARVGSGAKSPGQKSGSLRMAGSVPSGLSNPPCPGPPVPAETRVPRAPWAPAGRRGPARPSLPLVVGPNRPGPQAAETKERAGAAPPLPPPAPPARTPTAMATPPQTWPVGPAGGRGAWPRRGRRPPPCLPPLPEAKRRADKARPRRHRDAGRPRRPPPNKRGQEPRKPGALMQ